MASLRRAAEGLGPTVPDAQLLDVVRRVIASLLADGIDKPAAGEIRARAARALEDIDLPDLAKRYHPLLDPDAFLVQKRPGAVLEKEPFDRAKLRTSIEAAGAGLLSQASIESAMVEVEDALGARSGPVEASAEIRSLVDRALRRRDERAYIRYALGDSETEGLSEFLKGLSPGAQVRKRTDNAIVVFEREKLAKSLLWAFPPDRREHHRHEVSEYVLAEERRIERKMAVDAEPEVTLEIGKRALDWLFDRDELAWADYWLVFESDHQPPSDISPSQRLAVAQAEMQLKRENLPPSV